MKRDDFGMRIDEIRELATKYSKGDLARMVKMGMLDPQRALMAGMMIDRIAKSAMEPPQTTVAEDVLAAPTTAQGQIPAGIMGAPQAPAPSPGVAGLPSGMQNMAGGGIVAFAEGGDTDDIPGYAGGVLTDSRNDPAMKIDPRVQAKRDRDRYQILAQELRDAQNRMMRGDPGAKADFEALQREMRSVKPPRAMTGLETLIPSVEAGDVSPPPMQDRPASIAPKGPGSLVPPPKSSYSEAIERKRKEIMAGDTKPPIIQPERYAEKAAELGMTGIPLNPDIGAPAVSESSAPSTFAPETAPAMGEAAPTARASGFERPGKIEAEQLTMPQERTAKELYKETEEMYGEAGVDTNMYKNMMQELRDKKAGLKDRREQALGLALMSFGVDLAGAREGQEFERLGSAGQRALGMYMNSMDKIVENEDRLDALQRQIRFEENNYKRTGADSALARRDKLLARADNIAAKNAELKQDAAKANAQIGADLFKSDVYLQTRTQDAAARMAAAVAKESRAGMLTQKQRFDIEQQLRIELEPKLREQYKNHPNPDKKVAEELQKQIKTRIAALESQPSGYGGSAPPQDMFADWTVEGM